jgi:hypothetical protein
MIKADLIERIASSMGLNEDEILRLISIDFSSARDFVILQRNMR